MFFIALKNLFAHEALDNNLDSYHVFTAEASEVTLLHSLITFFFLFTFLGVYIYLKDSNIF